MKRRFVPIQRSLDLVWIPNPATGSSASFLWGARQTGKTTYLRARFRDARFYDLLDTDLSAELSVRPGLLREEILAERPEVVVIDEIQKVPALLEEVHWLLENTGARFVLCGSSARKLRRQSHNLLGGRAIDHHLLPLTSHEIGEVDLLRILRHGALPAHYLIDDPKLLLRAYINNYIKEEIIDESATRNIPAFTRFLQIAGIGHGQQINFANVARESGVSASTVRNYYQILEDTLLGFTLDPWRRKKKRRLVETAKFYFFDVGVANQIHPEVKSIDEGTDAFGRAFEHYLLNEVRAYLEYRRCDQPLAYWRTSSGFEVDLIIGAMELAVEFKSTREVRSADLKGMRALREEFAPRRSLVVSRVEHPRKTEDGIEIVPWLRFCKELWAGTLI
ncbi:MAG: AAA family ATPase [Candidatus Eisenbacteria bacterium]|uniref:AAA family ATPase n=1 Tax=Eiseniibacteriota bacterium TaxID=2212470 RepID=A0A948RVG7_UNCEI|nr:AAA family ATPase [Candidatus Eisenbacteria bacterium]MBU1947246.1 AAA family ATPase [Candidatus Eisenbacteria bacterium]MBU2690721.1 AAA family ATPase [Candidatus Eisenbacteria bacterium]